MGVFSFRVILGTVKVKPKSASSLLSSLALGVSSCYFVDGSFISLSDIKVDWASGPLILILLISWMVVIMASTHCSV